MTLKEMDRAAEAKREWLRERDRLTEQVAVARVRLTNLEAAIKRPDDASAALRSILALAEAIPDGLRTRGNGLGQAGGFDVRGTIVEAASNALIDVGNKRKRLEDDLPRARKGLAEIESALARHLKQTIHAGDVRGKLPEIAATGTASTR